MWQLRSDETLIYLWEGIAREYRDANGEVPFNVSHWDTLWELPVFTDQRMTSTDIIRYSYSYYMEVEDDLLEKLGFEPEGRSLLVTTNGTLSMLAILSYALEVRGLRTLDVLCPFYFVLDRQAWRQGTELRPHYMQRVSGRYHLPREVLHRPETRVVWITNPVFSASVYLEDDDLGQLHAFLDRGGIVIADESLALPGRELSRSLGSHPGFWGIYTPHKGLGTNGLKFSAAVLGSDAWQYLEIWSDAFAGSLTATANVAIRHFLSRNYEVLAEQFRRETSLAWIAVKRIVSNFPAIQLDQQPEGHFVMCYAPHIPAEQARDPAFVRDVVCRSGTTFLPALRSRFDPGLGLCFRLNLARHCSAFDAALGRLLTVLSG